MSDTPFPPELADFCDALPRLRSMLRGPASRARRELVDQAVATLRRGEPAQELLAQLDTRAQAEPASVEAGRTTLPPRVNAEPWTPGPWTPRNSYGCPRDTCHRTVLRATGGDLPACPVYGEAMRPVTEY